MDDYSLLLRLLPHILGLTTAILLLLETVGLPIAYHKLYLDDDTTWVGFQVTITTDRVDLTDDKKTDLQALATPLTKGTAVKTTTLAKYTHKLSWGVQVLERLRAFLAPLHAHLKGLKDTDITTPPALVIYCIKYIQQHINTAPPTPIEFRKRIPGQVATDAGATTEGAGVGGWFGHDTTNRWNVHWFMVPVTHNTHAWAYDEKDPQRLIASLELLGDIYYTDMIGQMCPGHAGTHVATATTDNQGNSYIINKHYTNKYPNMCLCMELIDKLTLHDLYLRVEHRDRTHNIWADQLAGLDDTGFDPNKRIEPNLHLPTFERTRKLAQQMGLNKPKEDKRKNFHTAQREQHNTSYNSTHAQFKRRRQTTTSD